MSNYTDEDYLPGSPGLVPIETDRGYTAPPEYTPLWLDDDVPDTCLDGVYFERQSNGLEARQRMYKKCFQYDATEEAKYWDYILLHHMNSTREIQPTEAATTVAIRTAYGIVHTVSNALSSSVHTMNQYDTYPQQPLSVLSLAQAADMSAPDSQGQLPTPEQLTYNPHQAPPILNTSTIVRKPKNTQLGLPITLHTHGALATVFACADTGADINVISDDLAKSLGYTSYIPCPERKEFTLANGKIVQSLGQIESACSFGIEAQVSFTMICMFHVLLKVATPIIMGTGFLEDTKTMTEHRERLVRVPKPASQSLFVRSVDRPRRMLACKLDGQEILSLPDSGSDIDLMSVNYATHRGFQVSPGVRVIELADGSVAVTSGLVRAELAISPPPASIRSMPPTIIAAVDFFLLDGLVQDVIVSEDSIEELRVFQSNAHALVSVSDQMGLRYINGIRLLGSCDGAWFRIKNFFHNRRHGSIQPESNAAFANYEDQRENDRREREELRIAALPSHEHEVALEAEYQRRVEHSARLGHLSSMQPLPQDIQFEPSMNAFKCNYPGCIVAPFRTQYLLNSHTNGHSPYRPYFCPVKGCPRDKCGRGFRRKEEMLRHSLVHSSPGHMFPFCPSPERKYPRPDNLQRHVRVHHADKDPNDPQLRNMLAQRREGDSSGRIRR